MFTDRFIKLPVELYNKKQAELTDDYDSNSFEGFIKLNPFDISAYRPGYNKEGTEIVDETVVDFKSGESVLILLHIDDFEKQLNAFAKYDH